MKTKIDKVELGILIGLVFAIILVIVGNFAISDSPFDEEPPDETFESANGGVYATIPYRDDLIAADKFFMEVKAHPKAKFPLIKGGYAETNVHVFIKLRGVSVPTALQTADSRARPHIYVERERKRFDASMDYIWSLVKLNKILKLHDPVVVVEDECVECDIEFMLGGQWVNLAASMMHDEHARPIQEDSEWDWGSRNVTLVNSLIPK